MVTRNKTHIAPISSAVQSACLDASEWKVVYNLAWAIEAYLDLQGHRTELVNVLEAGLSAAAALVIAMMREDS